MLHRIIFKVTKFQLPTPSRFISDGKNIPDFEVQMKYFFLIAEFERAAKIRKIAVYRFLISHLVPEL